jgi:hypothetical protein
MEYSTSAKYPRAAGGAILGQKTPKSRAARLPAFVGGPGQRDVGINGASQLLINLMQKRCMPAKRGPVDNAKLSPLFALSSESLSNPMLVGEDTGPNACHQESGIRINAADDIFTDG